MSYTIYFTDSAKTNEALVIDDNSIDSRLSVSFIGKNASNYSSAVSTNFLHLLENFSNTTPPAGLSVQGQLWFDTSNPDIPVLRIGNPSAGNGSPTSWPPANGIWAQPDTPGNNVVYGGAKAGDIWVNTSQGQLYINTDGTNNWTLVGPAFSGTLQTGSFPDTINDNFGVPHKIIKNFIDGNIVEIISNDSFIPQSKITGFTNILPGINLSSLNSVAMNATSYSAKNLYVTSPSNANIPANNFVRNDIDNAITAALTVKSGILLGNNSTFNLKINPSLTREAQIINSVDGGLVTFTIYNGAIPNKLVRIDGVTQSVGIGIPDRPPAVSTGGLEIGGDTLIGGKLVAGSLGVVSTFNGNLAVAGSISSTGTVTINNTTTINGSLFINSATISNSAATFATVTATNFYGNLQGTANIARSLQYTGNFAIQGDVRSTADVTYTGGAGNYIFVTTVTSAVITGKPVSTKVAPKDWTNFYDMPSNGQFKILGVETTGTSSISSTLVQIEKQNFLADIYANLIPTGAIIPFAGLTAPTGWLLCDGQGAYKSQYPALFNAIGYTYGQPDPSNSNVFGLPDLRGRGVVGYDDMNNGTFGLSQSNRIPTALKPSGDIGMAATVAGGTSTVFLSTGTVSTGTGAKVVVDNSLSLNTMNPYLALNYIIKT